ncbi:hypothetical protein BH11BAC4_BH11BAC4_15320 [soil metagenome]
MNANSEPKLFFVINPGAGADDNAWQDIISAYFAGRTPIPVFHLLDKKPNLEKLKKNIAEAKPDRIIAVGGDGTVTMVAKLIAGTKTALGILPAGSANGMAKELNIPFEPTAALKVIETGEIKSCDMIGINGNESCLHLSDIGLNAQLIKHFDEGKIRGKLGYARVVIKTLLRKRKMQVCIQGKSTEIKTEALMIVLANASKYGTGAVINPDGKLDDGLFEIVVVKKLSVRYLLKVLFNIRHSDPKDLEIFHAKTAQIDTMKSMHFQIDGEYKGKLKHINAKILPGHINLILPATGKHD